ncbi:DUF4160 domain-containing protein [Desulfonatronum thiosulfatophilum]|uniref:DUF4160 domain-containing protein n=1 Tax=Desulfonatronum thiosulfatophilum TaxID=617002 RepID=UPI003CC57223
MHVHVQRDNATCKFWLAPLALSTNHGFTPKDLNSIMKIIRSEYEIIKEAWHDHCDS